MKVIRFIGLFAVSYFLLIAVYVAAASIVAFYEQAPDGNRVVVLAGFFRDSGLSIFRESTRWLVGSEGLYSFVPTLELVQSTEIFHSLLPHCLVQIVTFGFLGSFGAARGCSLTMTMLLPGCLLGLTVSLLQARLLALTYLTPTAIAIVVVTQIVGIFLGSIFYSTRLR